ncbi:MAG: DoxX family membrane protein [bacterium]|nr:DoxX family membrane protein [bacterium]
MNYEKLFLFLLRVSLGWLLLYSGLVKILDSSWTAAGYLKGAKTFGSFYQWLASPEVMPLTNFLNEWGLTLLGVSLLLGVGVRWSGILGALLMLLYYFPVLEFPYIGGHSFLVDEHIVYIFSLLVLAFADAGRTWGLEGRIPLLSRFLK